MSNSRISGHRWFCVPLLWLASCLACNQSSAQRAAPFVSRDNPPQDSRTLYTVPMELPEWADENRAPVLNGRVTTIVPSIQNEVVRFIRAGGNPIAALVVVNVKTGEILAMAQGKDPSEWGAETHSALHVGFPSASLFKTITAAAGFEVAKLDPDATLSMFGSCSHVNPRGIWPPEESKNPRKGLTLRNAYAHSCNGFFAKLAVNSIGLGPILSMARKLGWNNQMLAKDFHVPPSPLFEPNPSSSSINTIGKFAAGFGSVGISAVHAAWQYALIANDGIAKPVYLFRDTAENAESSEPVRAIEAETATNLRSIMDATVMNGTATSAFRRGRFRMLRNEVGGKTGTLTGSHPQGLTTWFAGLYPVENPEIAVAAVTMLGDLWHFKASNLAAVSILSYIDYRDSLDTSLKTARKNPNQRSIR